MPRKSPTAKPSGAKAKGKGDLSLDDLLGTLDEATLARVRDAMHAELHGVEDADDPLAMFEEFLLRIEETGEGAADNEDFFDDLVQTLSQLAIDENGGDPQAREMRAEIGARLDEAMDESQLTAASLMLTAKIFNDCGWAVPERLKLQLVAMLESAEPSLGEIGGGDLNTMLAEIAEASDGDPFAAYDALNSVLAAFPSDAAARMVATLGEGRAPVLQHMLAGFAMHRDGALALAAIESLRDAARPDRVESALVERLVRMRPWLSADRQSPLDETIRALRPNALAPAEAERPKIAKCFVMACDGSGAGGALASLKAADGWRFVAAMTKVSGVEEVLSLEGLSKRAVDSTVRGMRANVVAAETDVAGLERYLGLALGENVAAKTPPPFKLIAFVENLGIGPIAPRAIAPAELIDEMLAGLPKTETDAAALVKAYRELAESDVEQPWFEAGEAVERLLAPLRGPRARVKALLTSYLPQRRAFWVRICALTAFVLDLDRKTYKTLGRSVALIGREIASGAPMEQIPLMREVAEATVSAYQSRL